MQMVNGSKWYDGANVDCKQAAAKQKCPMRKA